MGFFSWLKPKSTKDILNDQDNLIVSKMDALEDELDKKARYRKKTMGSIIKGLGKECELDNEFRDMFSLNRSV